MAKVKICGITRLEDALMCAKFGADALGFNFYEKSKRFIKPSEAGSILEQLDDRFSKFGVFVNSTVDEILDVVNIARINVIQLHGDESPEFVADLRSKTDTPIVKAFRVTEVFEVSFLTNYLVDAALLDSFSIDEFGGTGKKFNWSRAVSAMEIGFPIYLAGGLDPENVAEAVRIFRPYAVDVASGVESTPGRKDPAKVEAFIRNAKQA